MQTLATTPITALKGVGAKVAEKLAKIGLFTLQDVLFHLPLRYEDRTRVYSVAECRPFTHVSVQGEVKSADIQYGKKTHVSGEAKRWYRHYYFTLFFTLAQCSAR